VKHTFECLNVNRDVVLRSFSLLFQTDELALKVGQVIHHSLVVVDAAVQALQNENCEEHRRTTEEGGAADI
jgi:hypothetical protein